MARRIDIELTSTRSDGTWTWRAAGAKEPRGLLDGSVLYEGAKAGDVLRAEAEFEIEGITITSVIPPKAASKPEPQRIEVLGSGREDAPGVTTQLVGKSDRRAGDRSRDPRDSDRRRERDGRPRREGERPRADRPAAAGARGDGPRGERDRARSDRPRSDRPRVERPERSETRGEAGADRGANPDRRRRPSGSSGEGGATRREAGAGRTVRPGPGRPAVRDAGESGADAKARRLNPGHAHRQAVLDSLPPEQHPIAEQVLRGGIPAVRTALHLEREKATAEGRAAPNTDELIAIAEALLPRLKAAEWRDRAEAAIKYPDDISLRDLRSVVTGADVARDDETRTLAASLREALERRVGVLRTQWSEEITKHLDENRVVRALRLSARPPEPAARLDVELSQRLSDAAGQALAPDTAPDRWMALLDAAAASPVRRTIRPAGLPAEPDADLKQAAYQQSGRIPALATMLGVAIPPPPTPVAKRTEARRPSQRPSQRPATLRPPATPERPPTPEAPLAAEAPAAPEAPAADVAPEPPSQAVPADATEVS